MLNNKKGENGFLDALNNIDDELVEEVTEISVRPSRIKAAPQKSSFMRIVASAASLAVMAAVGIGALIIMKNLPSAPITEQTSDNVSESAVGEEAVTNTQQPAHSAADTTAPDSSTDKYSVADEILSQSDWQYINFYFDATNDNYGINNFDDLNPEDADTQSGMVVAAVFDRKTFGGGEYEIALLGFRVWTDNARFAEGTVLVRELRIALVNSRSNKIIAAVPVYNPLAPDATAYQLDKDYFDKYTQIAKFGEAEHVAIFRSINGGGPVPEALFYFIKDQTILSCKRGDIHIKRQEYSETLSAVITAGVKKESNLFTITDNLTGDLYSFKNPESNDYVYYFKGKSSYDWNEDSFTELDPSDIPIIDEFGYNEVDYLMEGLTETAMISKAAVHGGSGYMLYLIGQNIRQGSDGTLYIYNPQTIITKNGNYIGRICTTFYTSDRYKASMIHSNDGVFADFFVVPFIMDDTLLIADYIIDDDLGEGSFYAVKDDHLYSLRGNLDNIENNSPPAWTDGHPGYRITKFTEKNTLIYGYKKFVFDFDTLDGPLAAEYNYTVFWLEEPVVFE